jgi:hypothetical protein
MLRSISVFLIAIMACPVLATPSLAGDRNPHDATPFAHSPCSVLDDVPCPPTCSVLNHGPCIPEIYYPYGQDLHLTVQTTPSTKDAAKYIKPDHPLDNIGDLYAALRSCWAAPDPDVARAGMEMSVRFSIKRDGELVGPPRLTYATPGASTQTREVYRQAIDDALKRCQPLSLSKGLGGAIAGRPMMVRFVDNRALEPGKGGATPDHP